MKAWHFSENAYPYLPPADEYESIRVSLPSRLYDPKKGAVLYDRYIDEWLIAEDEGVEIMLNEHHQTATCVDPAAPLVLAALARLTEKARLLILGNPVANRRQPVRVAEEMAMVDVLSKGRLECGFVRGVPYEVLPANSNPVRMNERQWEAMDLIVKAWTSHDGPVSHEGRFFHHRNINIWPRPYQQPHPPVWSTTGSRTNARVLGEKGYVMATLGTGFATRPLFDAYRAGYVAAGRPAPGADRFGYLGLVAVADSEAKAHARAEIVASYLRSSSIVAPQFRNPPGYLSIEDNMRILRGETRQRS
ncbi:MAG: LLM class flavin-dependent oxidoreductase, partial [Xanthobacteraceae bacterium]